VQVMIESAPATRPHCCAVCAAGRHLLTASKTAVSPKQAVSIIRVRSCRLYLLILSALSDQGTHPGGSRRHQMLESTHMD
jgi:hypothetical protein